MPSIDAKLAAHDPVGRARLAAATSILRGAAIPAGRTRFVASEIRWWVPVGALVLWLLLLFGHRHITGVAPVSDL